MRGLFQNCAAILPVVAVLVGCQSGGQPNSFGEALLSGARAGLVQGLTGQRQANPYLSQAGSAGGDFTPPPGVEPLGPIAKAGCDGLEVVGYRQTPRSVGGTGLLVFYMVLRNNGDVERIVSVQVRHVNAPPGSETTAKSVTVPARQIRTFDISLSERPPRAVEVTECL